MKVIIQQKIKNKDLRKFFSFEKKYKFSQESISKILNIFIESDLEYEEFMLYFKDIQNIIVHLNKDPSLLINGTIMTNKIPKEWKLTDSITNNMKNYFEKEDINNFKPSLLLHNRILFQPRNDHYLGFNYYSTISENYHVYFMNLYSYISDNFRDLELIKGNDKSIHSNIYSTIYSKYHLIKILSSIVDFIEGLKLDQSDIINDAMPLYRLLEGRIEGY